MGPSTEHEGRPPSHHSREVLSNGLSDCQISGPGGQVSHPSSSSCTDVTAVSGSHGLPGMVHPQGVNQDAPSSLAAEGVLIFAFGQLFPWS